MTPRPSGTWTLLRRAARFGVPVLLLAAVAHACTYAAPEEHADVVQVVRLGDSYHALAVVRHAVFRRPTGLSAFPDGGKRRYLEQGAIEYLLDAESREVSALSKQDAPDSLWESFAARAVGVQGDSVAYMQLTGCPRGGECYPPLEGRELRRLSTGGDDRVVDRVPDDVALPGEMAARRPGETRYVRFGVVGDTVTARLDEAGPVEPLFRLSPDGSLEPLATP